MIANPSRRGSPCGMTVRQARAPQQTRSGDEGTVSEEG